LVYKEVGSNNFFKEDSILALDKFEIIYYN